MLPCPIKTSMRNRQLLIESRATREWAARTVIEFRRPLPVLLPLVPLTDVDAPVKVPARDEWRWGLFVCFLCHQGCSPISASCGESSVKGQAHLCVPCPWRLGPAHSPVYVSPFGNLNSCRSGSTSGHGVGVIVKTKSDHCQGLLFMRRQSPDRVDVSA